MKKLVIPVLLLVFIVLSLTSTSQWQQATGLEGANLTSMVSVDSVLLAVSEYHGLYRKTDNSDWHFVNNVPYNTGVIMSAGNCAFALVGYNVYKSFDGGITWEDVPNITSPSSLAIIDTVLFFGSGRTNRSFDYGETYDTIQLPEKDSLFYSVTLADDNYLYVQQLSYYLEEKSKLYYSGDYGETWDSITTCGILETPGVEIRKIHYLGGTFWAQLSWGTAPPTMAKIDQSTNSWIGIPEYPYGSGCLDMVEYYGKVLINPQNHAVYYYNDSTSCIEQFADPQKVVNQFVIHDNRLFCATRQGASFLDTTGNYTDFNQGLNHRNITSISSYEDKVIIAANNEIFVSSDGSETFQKIPQGYGFQIIATDSVYYTLSAHDFRLSRDEGSTWETHTNWIRCPSGNSFTHFSITNKYYFLGTMEGLFRTTPVINNWQKLENGPFNPNFWVANVEAIGRSVIASEYFFAQSMYRSNNFGIEFSDFRSHCGLRKVNKSYYLLSDSIYISYDQAQTWEPVKLSNNTLAYCIDRKGDTLVIGGRDVYANSIVEMCNKQTGYWNWVDIKDDLPESQNNFQSINEIKIFDGTILVANPDYGLWYRDDILTGKGEVVLQADQEYIKLYPNPTSSNITFSCIISMDNLVNVEILNIRGQTVYNLSRLQQKGHMELSIDLEELESGMYFYVIYLNGKIRTGKFFIID